MPSKQLEQLGVQASREEETESKTKKDKPSEVESMTEKREDNKKKKGKQRKNLEKESEVKEKIVLESKVDKESDNAEEKAIDQLQVTTKGTAACNNTNNCSSKRKRKEVFPFGNYRNYYGYRIGQDTDEDPRLKVFRREWFEGKDCLDIGCNSGVVTIQIARKFQCRSILGLDIDQNRVSDAGWHLRKFMRLEDAGKSSLQVCNMEDKEKPNCLEHDASATLAEIKENTRDCFPSEGRKLSEIVSFQKENFVHSRCSSEVQYDTILCLSVTKWVHMNWGDDGLFTLFSKIWRLLRKGGILVLEPQPWKSYEKNRLVSETTAQNFQTITHYPREFQEILLHKIGFRSVEDLTSSLTGSKSGFDRPILAFRK